MGVNYEKSKYISIINGGKGAPGQFGCGKMYWKLVFMSDFRHFLRINFWSEIMLV